MYIWVIERIDLIKDLPIVNTQVLVERRCLVSPMIPKLSLSVSLCLLWKLDSGVRAAAGDFPRQTQPHTGHRTVADGQPRLLISSVGSRRSTQTQWSPVTRTTVTRDQWPESPPEPRVWYKVMSQPASPGHDSWHQEPAWSSLSWGWIIVKADWTVTLLSRIFLNISAAGSAQRALTSRHQLKTCLGSWICVN